MTACEGEVVATARPWVATGRYVGVLNHKSYVAECRDGAGCWTDSPMAFANAELIVRSVNCHDELVAALKAMVKPFAMMADETLREYPDTPQPRAILAARAALTRAGGV